MVRGWDRQTFISAVPSSELHIKYWGLIIKISDALGREGWWAAGACLCALRTAHSLMLQLEQSLLAKLIQLQ